MRLLKSISLLSFSWKFNFPIPPPQSTVGKMYKFGEMTISHNNVYRQSIDKLTLNSHQWSAQNENFFLYFPTLKNSFSKNMLMCLRRKISKYTQANPHRHPLGRRENFNERNIFGRSIIWLNIKYVAINNFNGNYMRVSVNFILYIDQGVWFECKILWIYRNSLVRYAELESESWW